MSHKEYSIYACYSIGGGGFKSCHSDFCKNPVIARKTLKLRDFLMPEI
jgi:hypothetical protein